MNKNVVCIIYVNIVNKKNNNKINYRILILELEVMIKKLWVRFESFLEVDWSVFWKNVIKKMIIIKCYFV